MIAVLQRINSATVYADGELSGEVSKGLYILLGVERGDDEVDAKLLSEKISKLRIFSDENGKMNLSILDINGEALVVSNFTLNANYSHGNRPEYLASAAPDIANRFYSYFVEELGKKVVKVETGVFGSHMVTEMSTDGPVTIVMRSDTLRGGKK